MLHSLDQNVGKVIQCVQNNDLESRTLIIFLSDNGGHDHSPNTPLRGKKGTMWEGGIRIPFCMQWQGMIPAESTYHRPVSSLDILPTAIAAAGGTIAPEWKLDGVNLLPYVCQKNMSEERPHNELYWSLGPRLAIRDLDYKLATDDGKIYRLFDLATDRSEERNLMESKPALANRLRKKLHNWKDTLPPNNSGWNPKIGPSDLTLEHHSPTTSHYQHHHFKTTSIFPHTRSLTMSFPKPLFHNFHALLIALVWLASTCALGAELHPPEATQDELAKASYAAEKTLKDLPTAFIDTSPDTEDGLAAGTLGIDGGEVDPILKFANEIAAGTHGEVDSLLISYRGKLLFESYFRRGRVNYPHYQMSITKSYTALAIGRAIQCGYITMDDLDRPVCEFLKELDPTRFAKGAATITLADVMTMRSGIRIPQNVQQQIRSDTAKNVQGQHQVQMFFERTAPIPSAPREFKYQGIDPAITMQVLEAVVPGSAEIFRKRTPQKTENLAVSLAGRYQRSAEECRRKQHAFS